MSGLETGKLSVFSRRASVEDVKDPKWKARKFYKESISIEDLQTRKSYKPQENATELSLRPSWATKRLRKIAESGPSTR